MSPSGIVLGALLVGFGCSAILHGHPRAGTVALVLAIVILAQ